MAALLRRRFACSEPAAEAAAPAAARARWQVDAGATCRAPSTAAGAVGSRTTARPEHRAGATPDLPDGRRAPITASDSANTHASVDHRARSMYSITGRRQKSRLTASPTNGCPAPKPRTDETDRGCELHAGTVRCAGRCARLPAWGRGGRGRWRAARAGSAPPPARPAPPGIPPCVPCRLRVDRAGERRRRLVAAGSGRHRRPQCVRRWRCARGCARPWARGVDKVVPFFITDVEAPASSAN